MDLSFELDDQPLECAVRPVGRAQRQARDDGSVTSLLELTMDKGKFLALYDELLQAQALLQLVRS